ncbi:hypothetical protein GMMP15_1080002 [Candidatus Magnetomoraceae bacterium gMMP-15]
MDNQINTILIIDDNEMNIEMLIKALQTHGFRIITARNGTMGIRRAEFSRPDLILLDVMMPGIDGFETCRRLKANDGTKDIPVIFMTALTDVKNKLKGFEVGGVDYITKPFEEVEVLVRIKTHLGLRRLQRQLEDQNNELIEVASLREDVERIARHDIKTPLNAIILLPQIMMIDDKCPDEYLEYLQIIEKSGVMILNMINLSLDMFRMEKRIYQFQPVPVNVSLVIYKIINEMESLAIMKNLSVAILINGKPAGSEDNFSVWGNAH